jgi:hypothetical protein
MTVVRNEYERGKNDPENVLIEEVVSAMFVALPCRIDDPVKRLLTIRDSTKGAKEEHQAMGARTLLELGELAGPRTFGLAARLLGGLAARGGRAVTAVLQLAQVRL